MFVMTVAFVQIAAASPSIEANGRNLALIADANGDITIRVGNMPSQSIPGLFSSISRATSQIASTSSLAGQLQTSLSTSINTINVDISNVQSGLASQLQTLRNDLTSATRTNTMCLADLVTGTVPPNTEAVHGSCDLTTGGTCTLTCKRNFRALNSTNLAGGQPVWANAGDATPAVDGNHDRLNASTRWLAYCNNRECSMVVDLGSDQTISQFRFYNGHTGCTPTNQISCHTTYSSGALCRHYIEIWRGSSTVPLATMGNSSTGWETVVSQETLSWYGEEHPVLNPPPQGRFVRLRIDNRRTADCVPNGAGRFARIYEFEVLQGSSKDYTCTNDGLVPVDSSTTLECDDDRVEAF